MERRSNGLAALVVALLMGIVADPVGAGEAINARPGGLAVKGYDVVAYFTEGRATLGDVAFEHAWQGVRWRFANEDHLSRFVDDPGRYAPRYGGFCAGGVALGNRARSTPRPSSSSTAGST